MWALSGGPFAPSNLQTHLTFGEKPPTTVRERNALNHVGRASGATEAGPHQPQNPPALEPVAPRAPPLAPSRHPRPHPSPPPRANQELEKLKRGKREHQEERAALLRRLEEDKKERAEKFASNKAVAQQAQAASAAGALLRRSPLACSPGTPRAATAPTHPSRKARGPTRPPHPHVTSPRAQSKPKRLPLARARRARSLCGPRTVRCATPSPRTPRCSRCARGSRRSRSGATPTSPRRRPAPWRRDPPPGAAATCLPHGQSAPLAAPQLGSGASAGRAWRP